VANIPLHQRYPRFRKQIEIAKQQGIPEEKIAGFLEQKTSTALRNDVMVPQLDEFMGRNERQVPELRAFEEPEKGPLEKLTDFVTSPFTPSEEDRIARDRAKAQIELEARQRQQQRREQGLPVSSRPVTDYKLSVNPNNVDETIAQFGRDVESGALTMAEGIMQSVNWLTDGAYGSGAANKIRQRIESNRAEEPGFINAVAEGFGSLGTFLIPGIAIGRVMSGIGKVGSLTNSLAKLSGAGTMATQEALVEAGHVYRDTLTQTKSRDAAERAATKTFWLNLPLNFVTDKLAFFRNMPGKDLKSLAKRGAGGVLAEGSQELLQGELAAGAMYQSGIPYDRTMEERATEFGVGAITGGPVAAAVSPTQEQADQYIRDKVARDLAREERKAAKKKGRVPKEASDRDAIRAEADQMREEYIARQRQSQEGAIDEIVSGELSDYERAWADNATEAERQKAREQRLGLIDYGDEIPASPFRQPVVEGIIDHSEVAASDNRVSDEANMMRQDPQAKPAVITTKNAVADTGFKPGKINQGDGFRMVKVPDQDQYVIYHYDTVSGILGTTKKTDTDRAVREKAKTGEIGDILFNSKATTPEQGDIDVAITKDGQVAAGPDAVRRAAETGNVATAARVKADEAQQVGRMAEAQRGAVRSEAQRRNDERLRRERNKVDPEKDDILKAISKLGGLDMAQVQHEWGKTITDASKELKKRQVFGKPVLRRKNGRKLDDMVQSLRQYGYLQPDADGNYTINSLFEAVDSAIRGEPVMSEQAVWDDEIPMPDPQEDVDGTPITDENVDELFAFDDSELAEDGYNELSDQNRAVYEELASQVDADFLERIAIEAEDMGLTDEQFYQVATEAIQGYLRQTQQPAAREQTEGDRSGVENMGQSRPEATQQEQGPLTEQTEAGEQVKMFATPPTFGRRARTEGANVRTEDLPLVSQPQIDAEDARQTSLLEDEAPTDKEVERSVTAVLNDKVPPKRKRGRPRKNEGVTDPRDIKTGADNLRRVEEEPPVTVDHIDAQISRTSTRTDDGKIRANILTGLKRLMEGGKDIDSAAKTLRDGLAERGMGREAMAVRGVVATLKDDAAGVVTEPDSDPVPTIELDFLGTSYIQKGINALVEKVTGGKTPENVEIRDDRESGLGPIQNTLSSPSRIGGKIRYYVQIGVDALHKQDRLRGLFRQKLTDILKPLNAQQREQLFTVLWQGDALEQTFTREELIEDGIDPAVADAYVAQRKLHKQVWRLVNAHRKKYMPESQREEGKQGLGYREGHIPHLFENWFVYEVDTDAEGNESFTLVSGDSRSLRDAERYVRNLDPNKRYVIKPKTFAAPEALLAKTALREESLWQLENKMANIGALSREEAREVVRAGARRTNRRRFFGNAQERTGAQGFRKDDLGKILMAYYNSAARYVILDDFKAKAIPRFEKDFKIAFDADPDNASDPKAKYVKNYVDTLLGKPHELEKQINAAIMKLPFAKNFVKTERPGIWAVNKALHFTGVTKLGFLNLASGMINLTQNINTFAKVPVKHYAWAVRVSKAGAKLNPKHKRLLQRIGVEFDLGMADMGGHSMTHRAGRLASASMYPFSKGENMNRNIAALSAYRWAKQDLGYGERQALDFARMMVDLTQHNYSAADAGRIFQNPAGRLLGQFKPFAIKQMSFIYHHLDYKNPSEVMKFWTPTLLLSGLAGIPMAEWLASIIEYFTGRNPITETRRFFVDKAAEGEMPDWVAETVLYGLMSQLGFDISRRTGMSDVMPQRAKDWLGPTISTILSTRESVSRGEWEQVVKNIIPSIGNLTYAIEMLADEGHVPDRYRRNAKKYTAMTRDAIITAAGLRPLEEAKLSDLRRIRNYENKRMAEAEAKIADGFVERTLAGDSRGAQEFLAAELEAARNEFGEDRFSISSEAFKNAMRRQTIDEGTRNVIGAAKTEKPTALKRTEFLDRPLMLNE
jgi:hypothetical protein